MMLLFLMVLGSPGLTHGQVSWELGLSLSLWSYTLQEARLGFFTRRRKYSDRVSTSAQMLIHPLLVSRLLTSPHPAQDPRGKGIHRVWTLADSIRCHHHHNSLPQT